jgi:hypothetical protein
MAAGSCDKTPCTVTERVDVGFEVADPFWDTHARDRCTVTSTATGIGKYCSRPGRQSATAGRYRPCEGHTSELETVLIQHRFDSDVTARADVLDPRLAVPFSGQDAHRSLPRAEVVVMPSAGPLSISVSLARGSRSQKSQPRRTPRRATSRGFSVPRGAAVGRCWSVVGRGRGVGPCHKAIRAAFGRISSTGG